MIATLTAASDGNDAWAIGHRSGPAALTVPGRHQPSDAEESSLSDRQVITHYPRRVTPLQDDRTLTFGGADDQEARLPKITSSG